MLQIRRADSGLVEGITFTHAPEPMKRRSRFDEIDHERIAAELAHDACELASVLIFGDHLDDSLYDDPRHMHQRHRVVVSEAIEAARRQLNHRYPDVERVHEMMKERGLPFDADNFTTGDEKEKQDREFREQIENAIFEAHELALLPEILDGHREEATTTYDETSEEATPLPEDEAEAAWEKRRLEIFLPRVRTEYERQYLMPTPFNHWDYRNPWQQWFFVAHPNRIEYARGGSGGSGQREDQGRWAHVFATAEDAHGMTAPTSVLLYDERNELQLLSEFDSFVTVRQELTGNYGAPYGGIDALFANRIVRREGHQASRGSP